MRSARCGDPYQLKEKNEGGKDKNQVPRLYGAKESKNEDRKKKEREEKKERRKGKGKRKGGRKKKRKKEEKVKGGKSFIISFYFTLIVSLGC